MKKFYTLLATMLVFAGIAFADDDRIITFDQLPVKAQEFVKQYFPQEKITYVKEERDFMQLSYEVRLGQGTKVEFASNGEWKEVDCRYSTLDESLIPEAIKTYVKTNFPDTQYVKIEKGYRDIEIKLTNGLELTFNQDYKLIDIDD